MGKSKRDSNKELDCSKRLKPSIETSTTQINTISPNIEEFSSFLLTNNNINKTNFDIMNLLNFIRNCFPKKTFSGLPPLFYLHQLYILSNRTLIDRQIDNLRSSNKLRAFKFDENKTVFLCFTDDFVNYIQNLFIDDSNDDKKNLIKKYLKILDENHEMTINFKCETSIINKIDLNESEITQLVQFGLLTIKDSSSYWFSIPAIGRYRKVLDDGRRCVLQVLKKRKYNEIDINELNERNLRKINQIGLIYIICDLIGSEKVRQIETPTGFIIKLIK